MARQIPLFFLLIVAVYHRLFSYADPSKSGPLIPEKRQECFDVPFSIEKTCQFNRVVQDSYDCPVDYYDEICEEITVQVPKKCHRAIEKQVAYECVKQVHKRICSKVPISNPTLCTQEGIQTVTKSCPKSKKSLKCNVFSNTVPDVCVEAKPYQEPYDCWKINKKQECKVNFQKTAAICERQISYDEPYTYEEEVTETQCVTKSVTKVGCTRPVTKNEEYSCPETGFERVCKPTTKTVQKPCEKSKIETEEYDCSGITTRTITKTCTRPTKKTVMKQECDHGAQKKGNLGTGGIGGCVNVPVQVEDYETYPCEENVPVAVQKVCTREVVVTHETMCTETVPDEVCTMEPRTKQSTCTRLVTVEEPYDCPPEDVESCVEVPAFVEKTGVRTKTKTETYPCEEARTEEDCHVVEVPERSSCLATMVTSVEVPCTRQVMEQVCEEITTTVMGKCYEEEIYEEEYPCFETSYEERCDTVPIFEIAQCTVAVNDVEEFICEAEEPAENCYKSEVPMQGVCFEDRKTSESYTCYEKAYTRECVDVPHLDAHQSKSPPPLKKMSH